MHLAIIIITIAVTWKWGDWRNWHKYESTMIYIAMGNLLYNFLYYDHWLWRLKPDILHSHIIGEIFYTFIVLPCTVLLLLPKYPKPLKGQILHIVKFIAVYIILEWLFLVNGKIVYNYGWNIWWSLSWNCMMFPILVLHHKKPLIAYGTSLFYVIAILMLFPANLK